MAVSVSNSSETIVVDAAGQIVGRLSSNVAKLLLSGQKVVVVNAERALFSGNKNMIVGEFRKHLELGGAVHPKYGPIHFRRPDRLLTRTVWGMLPRKKPSGIEAVKMLRVYVGVPERYASASKTGFDDAKATKPLPFYVTLGEIASEIGWKGESS
ncbi:MAG: 50S ribosomal protein L13 [Thaumarchaeota archaeon]|nr:50S ribosomal protein L13 [Nitrososphaerota archaeon]